MVHAALLLLMLEAVTTDLVFTINLKRSTQNLQLSTRSPADYPIFGSNSDAGASLPLVYLSFNSGHTFENRALLKRHIRTILYSRLSLFPGNGISRPETNAPKSPPNFGYPISETERWRATPPIRR